MTGTFNIVIGVSGLEKDDFKVLKICFSKFNVRILLFNVKQTETKLQNFDFAFFQSGDLVELALLCGYRLLIVSQRE